jgi:recombination protein RecA
VANIWGEGFSPAVDIVNLGVKLSIVEMSGKWYCYGGQQIGEGILGVRDYMKNYPNMLDEIEREVRDFPEVEKVLFDNGVKPLPPKAKVS